MAFLLLVFFSFSLLHLIVAFNLPSFILQGDFPHKGILYKYFSAHLLTAFANFDGIHYILIAKNGYEQFQQSFFPLYPVLMAHIVPLFAQYYVLAGLYLSWAFFFLGLFYFQKLARLLLKDVAQARWAVLFLAAFPTAYYFQAVYTDSLLFFLTVASLYYLYRKKYLPAVVFAIFASLTKIQGALLVIPFIITVFDLTPPVVLQVIKAFSFKGVLKFIRTKYKLLIIAFAPLYGLFLYMLYLFINYKDPIMFYSSQAAFGAERAVGKVIPLPQVFYRYVKIILTFEGNSTYWISILELGVCLAVLGAIGFGIYRMFKQKKWDMPMLSTHLFSLAVLTLPTLTGTLTSVPRYALLCIGFFLVLAQIKHTVPKILIVAFFLILQLVLFVYFLKGYFIS